MSRIIIPYDRHLKLRARELRNHSTQAEIILWMHVKGKKLRGFDFHRQKPLYHYIVDFFCNELWLAIEIDGVSHEGREKKDAERQQFLESKGIRFLRFTDSQLHEQTHEVITSIEKWIDEEVKNGKP